MKYYKIICTITIAAIFSSCCSSDNKLNKRYQRFEVVYSQNIQSEFNSAAIIKDTETGVEYLYVKSGYTGGLTKLEE